MKLLSKEQIEVFAEDNLRTLLEDSKLTKSDIGEANYKMLKNGFVLGYLECSVRMFNHNRYN